MRIFFIFCQRLILFKSENHPEIEKIAERMFESIPDKEALAMKIEIEQPEMNLDAIFMVIPNEHDQNADTWHIQSQMESNATSKQANVKLRRHSSCDHQQQSARSRLSLQATTFKSSRSLRSQSITESSRIFLNQ